MASIGPCVRTLCRQLQSLELSVHRCHKHRIHSSARSICIRTSRISRISTAPRSPQSQPRFFTTYSTPTEKIRAAIIDSREKNPILLPVLFFATLASLSLLGLLAFDQYTNIDPKLADWPAPVEEQLRIALHFTHVRPDPDLAAACFVRALQAAESCKMDPFSKEVMGIRIRLAEMLENFGKARASIEILDGIVKDCEEKLIDLSRGAMLEEISRKPVTTEDQDGKETQTGLIRGIIQAKVKIAGIYDSDYLQDSNMAKKTLSDAVGMLVQYTQDPQTKGFNEDNAAGLSLEEIAAMLSQMGDLYATTGEEANAVQVYMLTLEPLRKACNGTRSCKEVQILSNIASSMALAIKKPAPVINGQSATKESLKAARRAALRWADQAIATADRVTPAERDEICDLGLLSAQMTKADLLLEDGDKSQSKEVFRSLLPLLKEKRLESLIRVAEEGIKRANA